MWGLARQVALSPRVARVRACVAQAYPSRTRGASVVGARKGSRFPACRPGNGRLGVGPGQRERSPPAAVESAAIDPFVRSARRQLYTQTHDHDRQTAVFHSNVCLAQPFESNYRCPAGRPSRGADVTTTADSATITAQDRSQGRLEPVHAMNEAANHEGPKRSLPGRP